MRCEPKLKAWKTLRRKIQNADLGTIETILDKYVTSPRTTEAQSCAGRSVDCRPWAARAWPTSTVAASKVSEAKGLTPKCTWDGDNQEAARGREEREAAPTGRTSTSGARRSSLDMPPIISRSNMSEAERPDVHGWTRHAGSKYWLGVWKLLANSAVSRKQDEWRALRP